MAAYLLADVEITDAERYQEYRARVGAVIAQYGGRFLIRAGAIAPLEGDLGLKRAVLIAFPDMAAARAFYDSPEYAPLLRIRETAAQSRVALIEGV